MSAVKTQTTDEKSKATKVASKMDDLKAFAAGMNKAFGENIALIASEAKNLEVERISSGCPELDTLLGGGFPRGRFVEIYGPESSGKSTITWTTMVAVQKQGGKVAIIDTEHALDLQYLEAMGVETGALFISQPDNAEKALQVVEKCVESNLFDLVVLDSIAALCPQVEIDGELSSQGRPGVVAKLMASTLRRTTPNLAKSKTVLVFINQLRMKIGVMYGSPETTTGGESMKYYASVRLDIRRKEAIKDGEKQIGQALRIKVVKNKVGLPGASAEATLIYGLGFDQVSGVLNEAVEKGVITKSGGSHYLGGDKNNKLAPSRDEMVTRLKNDEALLLKIKELNKEAKNKPKEDAKSA